MPNYEYQCKTCENKFEIWQAVGEAAPPCPECGQEVKKVFQPPRVHFKGSGFYLTDLRAEKSKGKAPESSETSSTAKSETKSEAKSEAKTEAPAPAPAAPAATGAA